MREQAVDVSLFPGGPVMTPKAFDQFVSFILVEDLERSCAFYADILGLKMVLDQGACRIHQVAPNSFLGICAHRAPPEDRSGVILTLVSDAVDDWYEHLKGGFMRFRDASSGLSTCLETRNQLNCGGNERGHGRIQPGDESAT